MSEEPDDSALAAEELEALKRDFIDYLDGKVAPLFAADTLSQMLRVEPPIHFTPRELADIVVNPWAQLRAATEFRPVHEYFLKSISLIITADRIGVLTAFRPSPFYMPYFEGLVKNCPPVEKTEFREKLKALKASVFNEWGYEFRRAEPEVTAAVASPPSEPPVAQTVAPIVSSPIEPPQPEILLVQDQQIQSQLAQSAQLEIPTELGPLVDRLRAVAFRANPVQEHELLSMLQLLLENAIRQPGFMVMPYLEALVDISISLFNNGKTLFAAQILYIVQQGYSWQGFDKGARDCLRTIRRGSSLDETQLRLMTSQADMLPALRVFLSHFDDFSAYNLIHELAQQGDRQKRRLLLSLMEAHGESAAPLIVDMLSRIKPDPANWFVVRNLVYLLGRAAPQDPQSQHVVITLIGPFLRSPFFQVRQAAIESLGYCTSEEALEPVKHVFDDKLYTEELLNNPERLSKYLNNTIVLINRFNSERAVRLLIEISLGRHIDFISEKLRRSLRLQAMSLLAGKREALSPDLIAPLLDRIRSLTSKWKKLVSRLLGEDEVELIALLDIVANLPTPPVIELLNDIRARYAGELSGRRAAELLTQLGVSR